MKRKQKGSEWPDLFVSDGGVLGGQGGVDGVRRDGIPCFGFAFGSQGIDVLGGDRLQAVAFHIGTNFDGEPAVGQQVRSLTQF